MSSLSKLELHSSSSNFGLKENYDATRNLLTIRSKNFKVKEKPQDDSDIWKRAPLDFNWHLYQPNPPKRNTRESMKPWRYDKYSPNTSREKDLSAEEYIKQLSKEFNVEQLVAEEKKPRFSNSNENLEDSSEDSDFQTQFRLLTPNSARMEAAKLMSYRYGLDQYKIPKTYDHRPLPPVKSLGLLDFQTRFEADPYNIKHLSENLRVVHGLPERLRFPVPYTGVQLGDEVLKQPEKYIPSLIHPRLPFPNQFYGYTRYRKQNRTVESANWERMLERINDKWKREKEGKTKLNSR